MQFEYVIVDNVNISTKRILAFDIYNDIVPWREKQTVFRICCMELVPGSPR